MKTACMYGPESIIAMISSPSKKGKVLFVRAKPEHKKAAHRMMKKFKINVVVEPSIPWNILPRYISEHLFDKKRSPLLPIEIRKVGKHIVVFQ